MVERKHLNFDGVDLGDGGHLFETDADVLEFWEKLEEDTKERFDEFERARLKSLELAICRFLL